MRLTYIRRVCLAVVATLAGCMTTRVATPAPIDDAEENAFLVQATVVKVRDVGAFNRGLQVAIGDGLQPRVVDAQAGLFTVERTQIDQQLTDEKAWGYVGATAPIFYRKFSITAVVGKTEATVFPSVVMCTERREKKCDSTPLPSLVADEVRLFKRILRSLGPPAEVPTAVDTLPSSEI